MKRYYFANKGPCSQSYGFSTSHVQMWELGHKEGWALKNWCFQNVVLERTLESPLDSKEMFFFLNSELLWQQSLRLTLFKSRTNDYTTTEPILLKGMFFLKLCTNDAEAETPVLWPPHAKSWLIGKDSDAGRDWGQEEKGMTEDEMAGWHHRLDRREFEWTLGDGDGQGGLVCCDSWGRRVGHDWATELNWTKWLYNNSVSCLRTCFSLTGTFWLILLS